jgi:acetyl-CoA carboxylase carboxyltransferase component
MELKDHAEDMEARREKIRSEMGGAARIDRIHNEGKLTIRERIDGMLDKGSFTEIGTFAQSEMRVDRGKTPGDGKIGGMGKVDGRPVVIGGDDITVKQGSSSHIGGKRMKKLEEYAIKHGHPIIYYGSAGSDGHQRIVFWGLVFSIGLFGFCCPGQRHLFSGDQSPGC